MKGSAADPVCPNPAIQPMQGVSNQRGRMRPDSFITMGYIGPSRTPMSETATAALIREGTSQTTSSRLASNVSAGAKRPEKRSEPDSEGHVNEYREPLADLRDMFLICKRRGVTYRHLFVNPQESNSTYSQASCAT